MRASFFITTRAVNQLNGLALQRFHCATGCSIELSDAGPCPAHRSGALGRVERTKLALIFRVVFCKGRLPGRQLLFLCVCAPWW